jgi:DNA-directed RNA polymerase I subunit RPA1
MPRIRVNAYTCKLRLLQYGLVDEVAIIDEMETRKTAKESKTDDGHSGSEEEDPDDLINRRIAYVSMCIHKAKLQGRAQGFMSKNPIAAEKRRALVKEFFRDIVSFRKCTSCSGYVLLFLYSTQLTTGNKNLPRLSQR